MIIEQGPNMGLILLIIRSQRIHDQVDTGFNGLTSLGFAIWCAGETPASIWASVQGPNQIVLGVDQWMHGFMFYSFQDPVLGNTATGLREEEERAIDRMGGGQNLKRAVRENPLTRARTL